MQIVACLLCFCCASVLCATLLSPAIGQVARAEIAPSEASPDAAERVFVSGVRDSFEQVRAAIEKAKQSARSSTLPPAPTKPREE